jgi:integrase
LVGDVAPRFLASAKFAKMEPMTQANYRRFCRWFAEEYGPWRADNFPPGEILAVARRISIARANSMRRLLRWAHGRGFVGADIWAGMEMPCYEKKVIKYLSPGEAHRFFSAVAKPFRAAFALALFAGLRPFEVVQMQWKNIHFGDELRIVVPAKISKVRKRRVIEAEVLKVFRIAQTGVEIVADRKPGIPEIVWRILEPLRGEPEEFILPTVRRGGIPRDAQTVAHPAWMGERRRAEKVSGVKLSQNIFRPTFLTFLVALRQDLALAAKVAGHASLAMLRDHYDGVEFRESAEDFFEIPRTVRTSHVDVSAAGVAALAGLPLPPAGGAGAAPAIEV